MNGYDAEGEVRTFAEAIANLVQMRSSSTPRASLPSGGASGR